VQLLISAFWLIALYGTWAGAKTCLGTTAGTQYFLVKQGQETLQNSNQNTSPMEPWWVLK